MANNNQPWQHKDREFGSRLRELDGLPYEKYCIKLDELMRKHDIPFDFKRELLPKLFILLAAIVLIAVLIFWPQIFVVPLTVIVGLVPFLGEGLKNGGNVK